MNIDKSVKKNIKELLRNDLLEEVKEEELYAWGFTESENSRYKNIALSKDDRIIIFNRDKEEEEITELYIGKVVQMIISKDLATRIWGNDTHSKVIIFKKRKVYYLKKRIIKQILNEGKRVLGPTKIEFELNKFEKEIERYKKEKEKKETEDVKQKILDLMREDKILEISEKQVRRRGRIKNLNKRKKKQVREEISLNYPKSLIGLYGEQVIYKNILESKFLIRRYFLNKDEEIKVVEFYNEGVVIDENGEFIDNSVEKGHDIKIITTKGREIKLEVKASKYKLNIFTLSYNELLDMKLEKGDNFIVLVSNVLENPSVEVIKDFSEIYTEEGMNIIIRQEIEVSKIPRQYLV